MRLNLRLRVIIYRTIVNTVPGPHFHFSHEVIACRKSWTRRITQIYIQNQPEVRTKLQNRKLLEGGEATLSILPSCFESLFAPFKLNRSTWGNKKCPKKYVKEICCRWWHMNFFKMPHFSMLEIFELSHFRIFRKAFEPILIQIWGISKNSNQCQRNSVNQF